MRITKFEKLHIAIQRLGASKSASELIKDLTSKRVDADPAELIYGVSGIYHISPDGILVKVILHLTDFNLDHGGRSGNINNSISSGKYNLTRVLKNIHKFHLINCSTLQLAKSQGWRGKYCISRKTDGYFFYRYSKNNRVIKEVDDQNLEICGNCLKEINNIPGNNKLQNKSNFDIDYFFNSDLFDTDKLRKDTNTRTSDLMPPNIYPDDWRKISIKYRENIGYQCEGSGCTNKNLSDPSLRKYLDCHHKDRDKSNSITSNLIALCVICHSKQPQHGHMSTDPRINQYKKILKSKGM